MNPFWMIVCGFFTLIALIAAIVEMFICQFNKYQTKKLLDHANQLVNGEKYQIEKLLNELKQLPSANQSNNGTHNS